MRALKFSFDACKTDLVDSKRGNLDARDIDITRSIDSEDRRTVGLLFFTMLRSRNAKGWRMTS